MANQSIFNGSYSDDKVSGIITVADYNRLKEESIKHQPITKSVQLKDIKFDPDALADDIIYVHGKPIAVEASFFKGLSKILNINGSMRKRLKASNEDAGTAFYVKLIDALKSFNAKNSNDSYTLMASPSTHSITNIVKGDATRISNDGLFGMADRLLNEYPSLSIMDVKNNGGDTGIKLLANTEHDFGKTNGPDGGIELFQFGMNLENSGMNTMLGDFAYRLVCENGMMGMKTINDFKLEGLDSQHIQGMMEHIQEVEARQFLPYAFAEHIKLADQANASLREVDEMFTKVKKSLVINDTELKDHYATALEEQYFRGVKQGESKIIKAGFDPREMTDKQKSFIDSGMNMWELINNLTFLGSHKTGFTFESRDVIQKLGGEQFHQEYDLAYAGLMKL